jgi:nucleoside phosphorylase
VTELSETLRTVLASAACLQEVVPDAVLVGGSAAALHAGHRDSFVHDHVLSDLVDRYDEVLEAVEATDGWATSVRASKPPFTIMGSLGGVEAGLRQMRRVRPLETVEVDVGDRHVVVAPTAAEALRVKAYLVVQRNAVRDHLDVVALADHVGIDAAVQVLAGIDDYYVDRSGEPASVLTSLVAALADPQPRDVDVIDELPRYKALDERWHQWSDVVAACQELALRLSGAL